MRAGHVPSRLQDVAIEAIAPLRFPQQLDADLPHVRRIPSPVMRPFKQPGTLPPELDRPGSRCFHRTNPYPNRVKA